MTNTVIKHFRIIPRDSEYLDRKLGSRGEIYFDQDQNTLRLYSGDILGGVDLTKADLSNVDVNDYRNKSVESKLSTVVYTVTVTGPQGADSGNKYNLNGVYRPIPNLVVGYTYVFVQDDQTNAYFPNAAGTTPNRHPLNFSADDISGERGNGTSYLTDVKYFLNGVSVTQAVYNSPAFVEATSRQVRITITNQTPATLYYWCWIHPVMGNAISVADPGSGGGGVSVSVDNAPPDSPNQGSLWLDTNTGVLYVYLDDGDSEQWIQPVFPFPDVTNLATLSYVDGSVANLASISYVNSAIENFPTEIFNLNIAADDSTQRNIQSGNTIKFIGAGGVTTSSDADGAITITGGGSTGSITFVGTTIDSADSSSIAFTPAVTFQSDVSVENELIVRNNVSIENNLITKNIILQGDFLSQGSGTPELLSDNEIILSPGTTTILNGLTTFYSSTEAISTKTGATGTVTHDFSTTAIWYHSSMSANFTANFTNVPTTDNRAISIALVLIQGATPYIPNVVQIDGTPVTINWQDNLTPTGNANKRDLVSFTLLRVGAAWSVIGSLSTYG